MRHTPLTFWPPLARAIGARMRQLLGTLGKCLPWAVSVNDHLRNRLFTKLMEDRRPLSDDAPMARAEGSKSIQTVQNAICSAVCDALSLYIVARSPRENMDAARELYAGQHGDGETDPETGQAIAPDSRADPECGLAAKWEALSRMDTREWEDLPHWQFLTQTIAIIAESAPGRRGWRTVWPEIAMRLRELKAEENTQVIWADLRERADLLRGTAPRLPDVLPLAVARPEGTADCGRAGAWPGEGGGCDIASMGEGASTTARELWDCDPRQAFERLRNRVCDAIHLVCEIHRLALATPEESLANVGSRLAEPLRYAVAEAQAIWNDTPIELLLDRHEGPVYLNCDGRQTIGGVSGSCYHDLALSVACGTLQAIGDGTRADDFTRRDAIPHRCGGPCYPIHQFPECSGACECQQGIGRWSTEASASLASITGKPRPNSFGEHPIEAAVRGDGRAGGSAVLVA